MLEFAVFDADELQLARVNRYRTLIDRSDIEQRMRALRQRTQSEQRPPDRAWLWGQFLTALLVGTGRFRRGERLSGRTMLLAAARYLAQLAGTPSDSLDPVRRFPDSGGLVDEALEQPVPRGALSLLRIASRLDDFPADAARAIEPHLG